MQKKIQMQEGKIDQVVKVTKENTQRLNHQAEDIVGIHKQQQLTQSSVDSIKQDTQQVLALLLKKQLNTEETSVKGKQMEVDEEDEVDPDL